MIVLLRHKLSAMKRFILTLFKQCQQPYNGDVSSTLGDAYENIAWDLAKFELVNLNFFEASNYHH